MKVHYSRQYKCGSCAAVQGDLFNYIGAYTPNKQPGVVLFTERLNPTFNYFEYEITNPGHQCEIGIGVSEVNYPLDRMPGWNKNGVGYHADDGYIYYQRGIGKEFGPTCTVGDRMGCGVDFSSEDSSGYLNVFFTKNGLQVGDFVKIKKPVSGLYPLVGMCSVGEQVRYLGNWYYLPMKGIQESTSQEGE